jgi:hypothetical protein
MTSSKKLNAQTPVEAGKADPLAFLFGRNESATRSVNFYGH